MPKILWLPEKVEAELQKKQEVREKAQGALPTGQTLLRVLLSCKGRNMKASHPEVSSGQLLVTVQRMLQGSPLQYLDDMEEVVLIPSELLPPLSQPGGYLELGERVHEILAQAGQDLYLGRSVNGSEPNRSMVFEVVVESIVNINTGGKLVLKVVEFGNFSRNEGIRRSAVEAFASLKEATSYSTSLRAQNRAAYTAQLRPTTQSTTTSSEEEVDPWAIH